MIEGFFERPILNSPYTPPARHWALDPQGQPTGRIVEARRTVELITPISKPKNQRAPQAQSRPVFKVESEFDAMIARAGASPAFSA